MSVRPGRRLGIDWGDARIGVAATDPGATLAFGVETVAAGPDELAALLALVDEYEPVEVIVGLPLSLTGDEGPAAVKVRARAAALAAALAARAAPRGSDFGAAAARGTGSDTPIDVRLVDERLSTVQAARQLRAGGKKAREQRSVIDQAAAREILERALEIERHQGRPPGAVVSPA